MQSWVPMALLVLTLVVCIIKTEQGISKNFDEEGKRKQFYKFTISERERFLPGAEIPEANSL